MPNKFVKIRILVLSSATPKDYAIKVSAFVLRDFQGRGVTKRVRLIDINNNVWSHVPQAHMQEMI